MVTTLDYRFEQKIARQRRDAARSAPYRDSRNDAPRCPGLYSGFREVPTFRDSGGSSQGAEACDRRLRAVDERAYADWRARNNG